MRDWWQATFPKGRQTLTITSSNGCPVKIAYGEKGSGKPILLVHGIGSWSYNWRGLIDPLAQQFRVICFDATGSGFSGKSQQANQPGYQVEDLKQVLQALCDEPAIVVAQSLGALVAMAVTEEHPELIDRLVLINVPIYLTALPNWGMRLLATIPLRSVRWFDQLRLVKVFAPLVRRVTAFVRREVVATPELITSEDVYWITYPYVEIPGTIANLSEALQQAAQEIKRLTENSANLISNVQNHLSAITCPTLIIWGEKDQWFPVEHGEKLHANLLNARFQVIPNCGHDAVGSSPEIVQQEILAFLHETGV